MVVVGEDELLYDKEEGELVLDEEKESGGGGGRGGGWGG